MQLGQKEVLDNPNLGFKKLGREWLEWWRRFIPICMRCSMGLGFRRVTNTDLKEMQWDGECVETEFFVQPELFKPEEVVANVLSEIATDELLRAVIEEGRAIAVGVLEGGTLEGGSC